MHRAPTNTVVESSNSKVATFIKKVLCVIVFHEKTLSWSPTPQATHVRRANMIMLTWSCPSIQRKVPDR